MIEFDINGIKYRSNGMNARKQFHVARRIAAVFKVSEETAENFKRATEKGAGDENARSVAIIAAINGFFDALAEQSDDTLDYVIDACLDTVSRKSGRSWTALRSDGVQMYDLSLYETGYIVFKVIEDNLSGFFDSLPTELSQAVKAAAAKAATEITEDSNV